MYTAELRNRFSKKGEASKETETQTEREIGLQRVRDTDRQRDRFGYIVDIFYRPPPEGKKFRHD